MVFVELFFICRAAVPQKHEKKEEIVELYELCPD